MSTRALHYVRRGQGPALVLLHGFTGTGQDMARVAGALDADFDTIAPDLPGHGKSVGDAGVTAYGFEDCVDRLAATLEATGHHRAHWLGYSMGARLALGCAVRHPESVASLLLIGARAGIEDPDERVSRRRADEALADRIEAMGMEAFVTEWLGQSLFASQRRLGREFLEERRRERLVNDARELAASLRGTGPGAQPSLHGALARVDVPVLLVAGSLDTTFVGYARDLARRLPDAEVCEIADAGHAVHLEQPVAFIDAARKFLRRATAPARVHHSIKVEETPS